MKKWLANVICCAIPVPGCRRRLRAKLCSRAAAATCAAGDGLTATDHTSEGSSAPERVAAYMAKEDIQRQMRRYCAPNGFNQMLVDYFYEKTGKLPNEPLESLNEKILWAQEFDVTPEKKRLADKYAVREWVAEKIGSAYLVELLGAWDCAGEVDFAALPDRFVLKCSSGSAMNMVVEDKSKLNEEEVRRTARAWLNSEFALTLFEMQYYDYPKKIIAERFLDLAGEYKLWCFHGRVEFIKLEILKTPGDKANLRAGYFSRNWEPMNFKTLGDDVGRVPRPEHLELLIRQAEILAKDFEFVRVDFSLLKDNSLKFGEMTFSPAGGNVHFEPERMNLELGKLWNIPERDCHGLPKR